MELKKIALKDAKKMYGENATYPGNNGNHTYNISQYGKYLANMTYKIPAEHYVKNFDETIVNSITINNLKDNKRAYDYVKNIPILYNGDINGIYIGSYYTSKNNKPIFDMTKDKNPSHILVEVDWGGGSLRRFHGNNENRIKEEFPEAYEKMSYFRRARSNAGGLGKDYYVFEVPNEDRAFLKNVKKETENNKVLELTVKDEEKIKEKEVFMSTMVFERERVQKTVEHINDKISEINKDISENVFFGKIKADFDIIEDRDYSYKMNYFKIGRAFNYEPATYSCLNGFIEDVDKNFPDVYKKLSNDTSFQQACNEARVVTEERPIFLEYDVYNSKIVVRGATLENGKNGYRIYQRSGRDFPLKDLINDEGFNRMKSAVISEMHDYQKSVEKIFKDALRETESKTEDIDTERNNNHIKNTLSKTILPEELWQCFRETKMSDSEIKDTVDSLMRIRYNEGLKDETDYHELLNCGMDRRMNAIERMLHSEGISIDNLPCLRNQEASSYMATFLCGESKNLENDIKRFGYEKILRENGFPAGTYEEDSKKPGSYYFVKNDDEERVVKFDEKMERDFFKDPGDCVTVKEYKEKLLGSYYDTHKNLIDDLLKDYIHEGPSGH